MHLLSKRLVGVERLQSPMEIGANEGESPVAGRCASRISFCFRVAYFGNSA